MPANRLQARTDGQSGGCESCIAAAVVLCSLACAHRLVYLIRARGGACADSWSSTAVAGKFGGNAFAARFVGQSWKDSLSIGALMNTRGLMELIVLNIGYDLGILSPEAIFDDGADGAGNNFPWRLLHLILLITFSRIKNKRVQPPGFIKFLFSSVRQPKEENSCGLRISWHIKTMQKHPSPRCT